MGDLTSAAASGDRKSTLIALRDKVARTIDECESGRDMAALSKRLMEIMDELDAMPDESAEPTAFERAMRRAREG